MISGLTGRILRLTLATVLAVAGWACAPGEPVASEEAVFRGETMGTYYVVKVAAQVPVAELLGLQSDIEERLVAINDRMSTYQDDSELSRFNQRQDTEPAEVSQALFEVVATAQQVAEDTGGAFDVTVGPLVNAWGFGPTGVPEPKVDEAEQLRLLELIGWQKLELTPGAVPGGGGGDGSPMLRKLHPELYVDLSGIAKGFAVDALTDLLAEHGYAATWVEVGGEVRASGLSGRGAPWRLGIERPSEQPGVVQRIVPLSDAAVATSGDYRNYIEVEGRRVSHLLDPRRAEPIGHRLASVSVVDDRCMIADALATALMVMGEDEGLRWAEEHGVAALFLVREGDGFVEFATSTFDRQVEQANGHPAP